MRVAPIKKNYLLPQSLCLSVKFFSDREGSDDLHKAKLASRDTASLMAQRGFTVKTYDHQHYSSLTIEVDIHDEYRALQDLAEALATASAKDP